MKLLTLVGVCVSTVWISAFVAVVWLKVQQAIAMSLNEWGDFLAGFSAPLALLWLVVGYFQQGEELRLNTEALKAQQEELRRQVEETNLLARNAERQASAAETLAILTKTEQEQQAIRERAEAQPLLTPRRGRYSETGIYSGIVNSGSEAINATIEHSQDFEINLQADRVWLSGEAKIIVIKQQPEQMRYPFCFKIHYQDKFGDAHTKVFEYFALHDFRELSG
jgi:hypothetical protein